MAKKLSISGPKITEHCMLYLYILYLYTFSSSILASMFSNSDEYHEYIYIFIIHTLLNSWEK